MQKQIDDLLTQFRKERGIENNTGDLTGNLRDELDEAVKAKSVIHKVEEFADIYIVAHNAIKQLKLSPSMTKLVSSKSIEKCIDHIDGAIGYIENCGFAVNVLYSIMVDAKRAIELLGFHPEKVILEKCKLINTRKGEMNPEGTKWCKDENQEPSTLYKMNIEGCNLNLINDFIRKQWLKPNHFTGLGLSHSALNELLNEPQSERSIRQTDDGLYFAGVSTYMLPGDQKHIEIITSGNIESYVIKDDGEILCAGGTVTSTFNELAEKLQSEVKPMHDLMVDLETLGTGPESVIVSIGAAFFNPKTGEVGDKFYGNIDLESSINYGDVDASTIKWWLQQSVDARKVFDGGHDLKVVLEDLSKGICASSSVDEVRIWGNGSTFDNAILRNAYNTTGIDVPWKFWNDRDVRTVVDLGYRMLNVDLKKATEFTGTQHNALDDVLHQIKYVSKIYQGLNHESDN